MLHHLSFFLAVIIVISMLGCHDTTEPTTMIKNRRIVSLKGAFTEVICALGHGSEVVGTDITSNFPAQMENLPKVGHNADVSIEGILSLNPNVIIADPDDMRVETIEQLKASPARLLLIRQEYTSHGTADIIEAMGLELNEIEMAQMLKERVMKQLSELKKMDVKPKVLFIYARGAGSLLAAGKGTPMHAIIEMAGAQNAVPELEGYKMLTSESLVASNPDVILLFETGLSSLNGAEGLLEIQGMDQTKAGKNKTFLAMDGAFISGFGPRLGEAVSELNSYLYQISKQVE